MNRRKPKQYKPRRKMTRNAQIKLLCNKLDRFVKLGESCGKQTKARAEFLRKADKVREQLREVDH